MCPDQHHLETPLIRSRPHGVLLRTRLAWGIVALALLAVGLWNLDGPPMWWDEGWTLSVARNWAERGHYGRLLGGEPAPPGLEAAFPVTLPVGLAMRLFGVGLWQGRLIGVLCSVVALLLLALLADRLYDATTAAASIAVATLLSMHPQIHPLLQGRQVLGEMPMLAYLLAGHFCLLQALQGRLGALVAAALLWGVAWIAKGQTGPFLAAALVLPALVALLLRRWRVALIFGSGLAGAYSIKTLLNLGFESFLRSQGIQRSGVTGLVEQVAVVLHGPNRLYALINTLVFGLPALLGLLYAGWCLWREWKAAPGDPADFVRLSLLTLAAGWLAWFILLSVGVPRYLAPPVFLASIFVAQLLRDLSGGFDLAGSVERIGALLSLRRPSWAGVRALLVLLLTLGGLSLTGLALYRYYPQDDRSAQQVAAFFNSMPPGSIVIETYESELHFLLNQPYHYPPDQIHVELNWRSLLGQERMIDYDPLAGHPAYLVVGTFAQGNDLYAPVLASGSFQHVKTIGNYRIYRRDES